MIKEKKVVIVGAGENGQRDLQILLEKFDRDSIVIIDNIKYGHKIFGIEVFDATEYLSKYSKSEQYFIISGKYIIELKQQLIDAGVSQNNIMTLTKFLADIEDVSESERIDSGNKTLWVFDFAGGFVMGGVERWTYIVAENLKKRGYDICFYTQTMKQLPPNEYKDNTVCFSNESGPNVELAISYFKNQMNLYKKIVFVCAHIGTFSVVSSIVKKGHPETVNVISVVHSSNEYNAYENIDVKNYVDSYFCVNPWMESFLKKNLSVSRIIHKPNPILIKQKKIRDINEGPIRIGYASRLEIEHKRVDLMPDVISIFEKSGFDYVLNIAGDGKLYDTIKKHIEDNKNKNVMLYGKLEYEQMPDFWRQQDIAINLSDSEGCPVSLLEAMEAGAVPVYTHTKGMDKFILEDKNGFVVDIGDMEGLVQKIKELNANRIKLVEMSSKARKWIEENCNIESYVDMVEALIEE